MNTFLNQLSYSTIFDITLGSAVPIWSDELVMEMRHVFGGDRPDPRMPGIGPLFTLSFSEKRCIIAMFPAAHFLKEYPQGAAYQIKETFQ